MPIGKKANSNVPVVADAKKAAGVSMAKPGKKNKKSSLMSLLLSFFPGLGLLYAGLPVHGLVVLLSSVLILPYLYSIFFSLKTVGKLNRGEPYGEKVGLFFSIILGMVLVLVLNFAVFPAAGLNLPKVINLLTGKPAHKKKPAAKVTPEQAVTPAPVTGLPAAQPGKIQPSSSTVLSAETLPEPKDYFEDGIPMYPGSEITGMVVRENYTAYTFTINAPVTSVGGFYKKNISVKGFTLQAHDCTEGTSMTKLVYAGSAGIKCEIEISTKSPGGITAGVISITKKNSSKP